MTAPPPGPFGEVSARFKGSWAVVIGINEYSEVNEHGETIPTLKSAVPDAVAVARTLTEQGFKVIALTDKQNLTALQFTKDVKEATRENLWELLHTRLPKEVDSDGHRVLFYWAGHGARVDSEHGPDGYLLPSDAKLHQTGTYLHMPGVHDALLRLKCRHMMVVLDACFSGAFRWAGMRNIGRQRGELIQKKKYDRFVTDQAWQAISSASQDQEAADELPFGVRAGDQTGHSPFAKALIEALRTARDKPNPADVSGGKAGGDGLVTAHELYLYIDGQLGQMADAVRVQQKAQLWPLKRHDKGEFVFQVGEKLNLEPDPVLTDATNPWVGLKSYDVGDAERFFGRTGEVDRLLQQVEENQHRLTAVIGASGTGKSSLVRAGLVPALVSPAPTATSASDSAKYRRQYLWDVLAVIRPGASPFRALLHALEGTDPGSTMEWTGRIRERVKKCLDADKTKRVALVIDRFEELIALARSTEARDRFLDFLADLLKAHDRLHLVVTLRSDFEPSFQNTALGKRWSTFTIAQMSRNDLRKVIELPAAKAVLYFKPFKPSPLVEPQDLVEMLVDTVVETPGALPLLSFVLSELYRAYLQDPNDDRAISGEMYDKLGGVSGALQKRANEVYQKLDSAGLAETMKHVMLRMVTREGGHLVGRRVTERELEFPEPKESKGRPTATSTDNAKSVMTSLVDAGLAVPGSERDLDRTDEKGAPKSTTTWELAHDAIAQQWGPLQTWVRDLDEAAARATAVDQRGWFDKTLRFFRRSSDPVPYTLKQRQLLTRTASEWKDAKSRSAGLWNDRVRSAQLGLLVEPRRAPWLNQRELEFVEESIDSRKFLDVVWSVFVLGMAALALAALVSGVRATALAARATSRHLGAETSNALANGYLDLAGLLSVEASGLPAGDTRSPILTWHLGTIRLRRYLHDSSGADRVALSRDDKTLATASGDGTITLWDFAKIDDSAGPTVTRVRKHGQRVTSMAFSPNGRTLAWASKDSTVILWDTGTGGDTGRRERLGGPRDVTSIAFSPDGKMLATAGRDSITLWNVEGAARGGRVRTNDAARRHIDTAAEARAITNSPDTSGSRRVIGVLRDPQHQGPFQSLAFSPAFSRDNTTLASVKGGAVLLWPIKRVLHEVKAGDNYWDLSGKNPQGWPSIYQRSQPDRTDSIAHPHWIFPGDVVDSGLVKPIPRCLAIKGRCADSAVGVAFGPDGKTVAVASRDTVFLWDVASGQLRDQLGGLAGGATTVAFSRRIGTMTVAAATDNGAVIVWDVTQKGDPKRIGDPLYRHPDAVSSLAFDQNGEALVSASEDGKVLIWDVSRHEMLSSRKAPEGQEPLKTGQRGAAVWSWDLTPPHRGPAPIAFNRKLEAAGAARPWRLEDDSFAAAISPDRRTRVSASRDGRIIVSPEPAKRDPKKIDTLPAGIRSVAFRPGTDETLLATLNADSTVTLWPVGPKRDTTQFLLNDRHRATSVGFSPDGKTLAAGTADGAVIRWSVIDRRRLGSAHEHRGPVVSLAYAWDGYTLASADSTTVILWDVENARRLGAPLRNASPIRSLAFSPDGSALVAVDAADTQNFWDFRVDSLLKPRACQAAGRNLTDPEWRASFDDRYQRACGQYPQSPSVDSGWKATASKFTSKLINPFCLWGCEGEVSGTSWRAHLENWAVPVLANSPRVLTGMAHARNALLVLVGGALVWLVWRGLKRWGRTRRRLSADRGL